MLLPKPISVINSFLFLVENADLDHTNNESLFEKSIIWDEP